MVTKWVDPTARPRAIRTESRKVARLDLWWAVKSVVSMAASTVASTVRVRADSWAVRKVGSLVEAMANESAAHSAETTAVYLVGKRAQTTVLSWVAALACDSAATSVYAKAWKTAAEMELYSVVQMEVYSVGATAPRSVSSKDCLMVAWTVDTKDGWWVFLVGWMSASSWSSHQMMDHGEERSWRPQGHECTKIR